MQTLCKLAFKHSRKLVSLDAKRQFVFKNPSKQMPKSLVDFNHDTRPLKTRLGNPASSTNWASRGYYTITCHRLKQWSHIESTRGEPGLKTKLSMRSLSRSMTSDGVVTPWGLVCRRGRITQAGFQRSCVVVGMYKALLKTNCRLASVRPDCLANDMRWNETRTYWLGLGVGFVADWTF